MEARLTAIAEGVKGSAGTVLASRDPIRGGSLPSAIDLPSMIEDVHSGIRGAGDDQGSASALTIENALLLELARASVQENRLGRASAFELFNGLSIFSDSRDHFESALKEAFSKFRGRRVRLLSIQRPLSRSENRTPYELAATSARQLGQRLDRGGDELPDEPRAGKVQIALTLIEVIDDSPITVIREFRHY